MSELRLGRLAPRSFTHTFRLAYSRIVTWNTSCQANHCTHIFEVFELWGELKLNLVSKTLPLVKSLKELQRLSTDLGAFFSSFTPGPEIILIGTFLYFPFLTALHDSSDRFIPPILLFLWIPVPFVWLTCLIVSDILRLLFLNVVILDHNIVE